MTFKASYWKTACNCKCKNNA